MERNIWKYGEYDLDKDTLFEYLQSNLDSYLTYHDYNDENRKMFADSLGNIKQAIINDQLENKNGFGEFTDYSNTLGNDEITGKALNYLHKVATRYGSKLKDVKKKTQEEQEKEQIEQLEDFDYNKQGLFYSFNKEYNPFGNDSNYDLWKSSYTTQDEINNAIADYIGQHRTKISQNKFNWSKSPIDQDRYNSMLQDLENDIRRDGIQDSDKLKLKSLGFNPQSFILPNKATETTNTTSTQELTEEQKKVEAQKEAEEISKLSFSEYLGQDWTESDKMRLKAIGYDLISILDPEPISSAIIGYRSDYLNQKADELEGGSFGWDDAANYAMSTIGAVPVLGDTVKGFNVLRKLSKIQKPLIAALTTSGALAAVENGDAILSSVNDLLSGNYTVENFRNLSTAVQLLLGGANAYRSVRARDINLNNQKNAKEALVVEVKNKGKQENLQFTGDDAIALKQLQNDPDKFKQYLKNNFENLDDIELANIKSKHELTMHKEDGSWTWPTRKVKSQEVQTKTKAYDVEENNGSFWTSRSKWYETYQNDGAVKATAPTKKTAEQIAQEQKIKEQQQVKEQSKQETSSQDVESKETAVVPSQEKTVNASEIKADTQSKANESVNTKSEVGKYNASNIRKEFDKLKRKNKNNARKTFDNMKTNKQFSDLVKKDPSNATEEFNTVLARLQEAGHTKEAAFKMLTDAGYYEKGGVIKAQEGAKFPEWFNYKQQALTGWHKDLNKDKWLQTSGFHTDADSLQSVFDANNNYTSDLIAIGNDLQNYHDNGQYSNITDLVKSYNTDANNINSFWNNDHTYGENTGNHAQTFKKLFNSRSTKNGNINYNLGYQEDLDNVMGSTMWHRRMDWYEKPFDQLTDLEKQNRIHAIKLASGDYGYVYKNQDGTLGELASDEAQRILNLKKPENVTSSKEKVSNNLKGNTISPLKETDNEAIKQPAPEKPKETFFTADKALAALQYFRARGHNKQALEDAQRIVPLLYDTMNHHRSVYGNLRAIAEGNKSAGQIRNLTSRPTTSDGSLWLAGRLEGENLAQQYIRQGWQSDDETMRQTSELAWQQEKENTEHDYNIAMKNRENQHQVNVEKIQNLINKNRADYESGTNFINEARVWIDSWNKAKENRANLAYSRQLSNHISNNPQDYVFGWGPYLQSIWDKYNTGETLSQGEQRVMQQIRDQMSEAYYNKMYGIDSYYGSPIKKPEFTWNFRNGGKVTNDMVKTIIAFLKESNKNYHKDIDRSVKGLYNHIKLQRKK